MHALYFFAPSPAALVPHLHGFAEHHWSATAAGIVVVARPRNLGVRARLAGDAKLTLLPASTNPRVLTSAEIAACPPAWGITAADTAFSALKKACARHGAMFDPEA